MFRFILYVFFLTAICTISLHAQQLPANIDFATIDVDNLSDQQLQQLLQKAQQNGLSVDDVLQQAQAKGMPPNQVSKLRDRLSSLSTGTQNQGISNNRNAQDSYSREYNKGTSPQDSLQSLRMQRDDLYRRRIFGANLFSNTNLTFEPNLNIPTPGNYVIGAGDELIVDVYGYSEKSDRLKVSPDGFINLANIGPIMVTGLTIDEAKVKITSRLTSIYSSISKGATHVQVLLGNIRSIRVMVIGEVRRPGSYTIPSLATVANVLYVSGGPDVNGSFRDIQVIRDGKAVAVFDLYDFLLKGSLAENILLQDQDIIKINPYKVRVVLDGQVKHPAIFEAKNNETLQDIIDYAGGFTSAAYKGIIRAVRIDQNEREILTIPQDSFQYYHLHSGDSCYVDSILNRFTNRVVITGAVFHPGDFALESGLTIKGLIGQADGVTEDAFMDRGLIKRLGPDFGPEIVNFDVKDELSGAAVTKLDREDSVFIYSKFKLRELYYVIVRGDVNKPDTLPFADNMKVGDAILLAGGLRDAASLKEIEVGRRARSQYYDSKDTSLSIVSHFSLQGNLNEDSAASSFLLQPFDQIIVRHAAGYHEQSVVEVQGQVVYPGAYIINSKNEKISDLIRKSGGLKPEAFPEGALLVRTNNRAGIDNFFEQNKLEVFADANVGNDSLEISRIKSFDSTAQLVGINLERAIQSPGSKYDLLLESGDIIHVPKRLETVSLYGEVFYPKKVRFDNRYRFKDFISQGGGFTSSALRRKAYIVYPNGEVASTNKVFLFNHFPKVKPGSEIFVPAKKQTAGLTTQEVVGLMSGLVGILAVVIAVIKS